MTGLDPRSLFEMAARTEPDTTERYLLLIAAIDAVLEPDVVLVGWPIFAKRRLWRDASMKLRGFGMDWSISSRNQACRRGRSMLSATPRWVGEPCVRCASLLLDTHLRRSRTKWQRAI